MTANLDGTFWAVYVCGDRDAPGTWLSDAGFVAKRDRKRCATQADADALAVKHKVDFQWGRSRKYRHRVSLVVAVRRCKEARQKNVPLYFRRVGETNWYAIGVANEVCGVTRCGIDCTFGAADILARYIVATPEDAAKLDRRKKT